MSDYNQILVPIFELDERGSVIPNYLFHRSYDYVHSRCIEYPFAASQVKEVKTLLDIGSVKADRAWINWLENLPLDVYAIDYDNDDLGLFKKAKFHQSDARNLPFPDNHFDMVLAVSVIEHIGLASPQVNDAVLPQQAEDGDIAAFSEFLRVLKPNGRLVMTFPYSFQADSQEQRKSARIYNEKRLEIFNALAAIEVLDYYEYQYIAKQDLFIHQMRQVVPLRQKFLNQVRRFIPKSPRQKRKVATKNLHQGKVTWRRIPRSQGKATNQQGHIDGIICGVWIKRESAEV